MLRTIDRNSLQLLRVAEDLLADPGGGQNLRVHFVNTDLALIATEAIDTMAAQAASRRIELSLVAHEPVVVNGDPDRLHQLFGNLLSNAVKFTPPGGRVMVRVGTLGHFARLEVLDDGPGIPDVDRPQLFERFYRLASAADEGVPGTGLGSGHRQVGGRGARRHGRHRRHARLVDHVPGPAPSPAAGHDRSPALGLSQGTSQPDAAPLQNSGGPGGVAFCASAVRSNRPGVRGPRQGVPTLGPWVPSRVGCVG